MSLLREFNDWSKRKFQTFYHDPPLSSLFTLLTALFLGTVGYSLLVLFLHHAVLLGPTMRVTVVSLLVLLPLPWLHAYVHRRRLRRIIAERGLKDPQLLEEIARSAFGLVLVSYGIVLFGASLLLAIIKTSL